MDNVPLGHPGDNTPPGFTEPSDLSEAIDWLHESAAEITRLRRELEEARERIRDLECQMGQAVHPCDMSHHVAKWTPEIRQATLSELLEAEARERVEVDEIDEREDEQDDVAWRCLKYSIRVDRYDVQVDLDLQGSMDDFDDTPNRVITPEMRMETVEEVEALILCLAAALAEKRKREEVAS